MATALPAVNPDHVFINCPFDRPYKPLFDSIVFTVHELGFQARHALIGQRDAVRLRRIANELAGSRYSIHDLSRVQVSGPQRLPRFNMPFEAGMAYCLHQFPQGGQEHHLLLLDAVRYQAQASTSDVAGLDPTIHNNQPRDVITAVRNFLVLNSGAGGRKPGAGHIWNRYQAFLQVLRQAARAQHLGPSELRAWYYVPDLQALMVRWIRENPA
jgi:hypothetical protein